jgi:hypothetical protein
VSTPCHTAYIHSHFPYFYLDSCVYVLSRLLPMHPTLLLLASTPILPPPVSTSPVCVKDVQVHPRCPLRYRYTRLKTYDCEDITPDLPHPPGRKFSSLVSNGKKGTGIENDSLPLILHPLRHLLPSSSPTSSLTSPTTGCADTAPSSPLRAGPCLMTVLIPLQMHLNPNPSPSTPRTITCAHPHPCLLVLQVNSRNAKMHPSAIL